jgi:esterase/lipase
LKQSLKFPNQDLLVQEEELFNKEYKSYFVKDETKPKNIGEPYLMHNSLSKTGILLIHGLMAAPEEVREWAEFLYSKGYTVYALRLAGHGTSAVDLSTRRFNEWIESVNRGYAILKPYCDKVIIGGFSTGAGLALYQVIRRPDDFCAVISISAPLKFKGISIKFVEIVHAWNSLVKNLGVGRFSKKYAQNHPDNPEINYHRCPIRSLVEVRSLMREVYKTLSDLSIPSLVIQGKSDPKVNGESGKRIFQRIGNSDKYYKEIDFHQHGIIRGEIARSVFDEVERFLNKRIN